MKTQFKQILLAGLCTALFSGGAIAEPNTQNKQIPVSQQMQHQKNLVEVAFVLDTTGSMRSLIDGAKKKIWSIANTIVDINPNAEIRMALVAYRDRGDDYVVKTVHNLDTDVQSLYSALTRLDADGGGDMPESVNEALDKGVNKLQWSTDKNAKRVLFLVGDAPPHMDYLDEKQYPAIITEATEKSILVNTVQAGDSRATKKVWKKMARLGKGTYLAIPQDGGQVVQIDTPYDDEILRKQEALDTTIIVYGDHSVQAEVVSKMRVRSAAPKTTQVDNASYYAKKKGVKKVISGAGDLVADIKNKEVALEELEESKLPEVLKNKSTKEKQAIIQEKLKKRQSLEAEIATLVKQRDDYLKQHKTEKPDSFDGVVKETLSKQLKDK
ncbi:vWA domain-containing protein [Pasteurella atlantica]|uniref:vWA domain-containing protein n=1 Tax=Pasteurellaceae TaxID=712 RepID=UPI00277034C2|nr:vWA domain-containing protein [Pasteurella atlantica]MDP8033677.1 vWA domain-containing protein [Pasteurella atlantica]MDP8035543.1 vWA domain-containing protein [Pasteurella atlantica]MDP8037494.1 vWA domain-containing protein [Pasteurella atlantica]MDP8047843.1 vWA domain-containing protein [Pasteurella atlantica]MDP8049798.1 vWA domain-containing protein [Pasteurella atlantica]